MYVEVKMMMVSTDESAREINSHLQPSATDDDTVE